MGSIPNDGLRVANAVAEQLADDAALLREENALLRERIESLDEDVRNYADLAKLGIHAVSEITGERDSLRRQNAHLREQLRQQSVGRQSEGVAA